MIRYPARRSGVALLEAVVALAIVVVVGGTALPLIVQAQRAIGAASALDRDREAAERFMSAILVWTSLELDARLGARENGPWDVAVQRPEPGVYRVRVTLRERPALSLECAVIRPGDTHGA